MRRALLLLCLAGCGSMGYGLEVCAPGGADCTDHGPVDESFAALSIEVCSDRDHEARALEGDAASGIVTPAVTKRCQATFIEWRELPSGRIRVLATPTEAGQRFTVRVATGGISRYPAVETVLDAEGEVAQVRVYELD